MIQQFSDWVTYDILSLIRGTEVANSVNFFVYDSVKIMFLLIVITHFVGVLRHYLPVEKIKTFLTSRKFFGLDYFLATIFGAVSPFCSCSSVPLFIGFVEAGIPLGVTFAFLITSPLINEVALALFVSVFGWKIAGTYLVSGVAIGMVGGFVLGKLKMERYIEDYVWRMKEKKKAIEFESKKFSWDVAKSVSKKAMKIVKKVGPYVLIGVGVGAFIHGYVPEGFFEKYITKENPFAVILAVILAVPLYSNASGAIPIIQSLVDKGVPLGTALAFMMAIVGLSFPEALILRRVMKIPLLVTFFGIVATGIILIGYIFNLIF
ncbi:MAG: permease [Candidatus Moranbacteria bacterium]|nr:permease [Candidatus Moranbacteria bacterium]